MDSIHTHKYTIYPWPVDKPIHTSNIQTVKKIDKCWLNIEFLANIRTGLIDKQHINHH